MELCPMLLLLGGQGQLQGSWGEDSRLGSLKPTVGSLHPRDPPRAEQKSLAGWIWPTGHFLPTQPLFDAAQGPLPSPLGCTPHYPGLHP